MRSDKESRPGPHKTQSGYQRRPFGQARIVPGVPRQDYRYCHYRFIDLRIGVDGGHAVLSTCILHEREARAAELGKASSPNKPMQPYRFG